MGKNIFQIRHSDGFFFLCSFEVIMAVNIFFFFCLYFTIFITQFHKIQFLG